MAEAAISENAVRMSIPRDLLAGTNGRARAARADDENFKYPRLNTYEGLYKVPMRGHFM